MTRLLSSLLGSCRYSGLSIKYVRGADPVIKLLDDADEVIEVRVPYVLRSSRSINLNFAIFLLNVDLGYRQVEHRLCWRIPRYLRHQRRRWGAGGELGVPAMIEYASSFFLFGAHSSSNVRMTMLSQVQSWSHNIRWNMYLLGYGWDPNKNTHHLFRVSHVRFM